MDLLPHLQINFVNHNITYSLAKIFSHPPIYNCIPLAWDHLLLKFCRRWKYFVFLWSKFTWVDSKIHGYFKIFEFNKTPLLYFYCQFDQLSYDFLNLAHIWGSLISSLYEKWSVNHNINWMPFWVTLFLKLMKLFKETIYYMTTSISKRFKTLNLLLLFSLVLYMKMQWLIGLL